MLKTSQMLTITVPKQIYRQIKKEAWRRKLTVSGLIRESFSHFVGEQRELYTDREIKALMARDRLSPQFRKELDILLR